MNPVHPYLNPQENPSHALYRLLALLPKSATPLTYNEAQLAEAICFQARRRHHIICASMPEPASTVPTLSAQEAQALLAQYDRHYYFPLGKLLQQLPADISNVPRLSPEQGQMCVAVSQFARQAMETLRSGLDALDKLLSVAREYASHASNIALPDVRGFVAYLQAEADFMQECRDDYRDAASHVLRMV